MTQLLTHLIFDFFGTLVAYSPSRSTQGYAESHSYYAEAGGQLDYAAFVECWSAAFSELDRSTRDSLREYSMGEAAEAFSRHASFPADSEVLARLASTYLMEWNAGVRSIDDVAPMLERLATAFDLSIITNTHDPDLVPSHLARLGVADLFSQVITSVSFGRRKPSASIFHFALDRLSISPARCIYIGDSLVPDFQGPRAVGIDAILIDPDASGPVRQEERIGSILDLEAALPIVSRRRATDLR